jgi:hypothetical protein
MDRIKVKYGGLVELMDYVGPCYNYGYWLRLVWYMRRYAFSTNYIQLKYNDHNKWVTVYIDWRPNALENIEGIINSTRPKTTRNQSSCISKGLEGNWIFVCVVKIIVAGENLLIDYDLNRIDGSNDIMGVNLFYQYTKPVINFFFFISLTYILISHAS